MALIRLRKPLQYYKEKYGTYTYALDKLYLLMEKQHNRGQEAAGVGVVKLNSPAGHELIFRERALGKDAIPSIFSKIGCEVPANINDMPADEVDSFVPYIGEIYMGHLRYSTTGKSGINYAHPVLRRNNWRSRSLILCGNFNMTNVSEMFERILATGQHPRIYSDTNMILEQVGYELDKENHRLYKVLRSTLDDPELAITIEDKLEISNVLRNVVPSWDGGYVMCGATGSGDVFAVRDSNGIRPAFYYYDDEIIVVASERPVIQTVFDVAASSVNELEPGMALIVNKGGEIRIDTILPKGENHKCSFERIYFSRGSDCDIYHERKALGEALVKPVLKMLDYDVENSVFTFIPNTAEVAFFGMLGGLEKALDKCKLAEIKKLFESGEAKEENVAKILSRRIRAEKVAIKDVKMRTFIAEGSSRDDMVAHVYDVTYGTVKPGEDTLIAIDDSIVRGTTLRQSILRQLDRLKPKRIIIVSSSPQVRYPDYYGIDMSALDQFIAFHAAIRLLKEQGKESIIHDTYRECIKQREFEPGDRKNCVKAIYEPFTDDEISSMISKMLVEDSTYPINAQVNIVYQSLEGMHKAIPNHPGDWYFSGNYPTPGGTRLVNEAFINYYENEFSN